MTARADVSIPVAVLLALGLALGASAQATRPDEETPTPDVAKIDQPVPDFTLRDTRDQEHALSTHKGSIVVLEWIDPECPIVGRLYRTKTMAKVYEKVREIDPKAVWLAINSNPDSSKQTNAFWITQFGIKYPILLDPEGAAAGKFDARRTPHLYVIDREGVLRYQGALDDNALGTKSPDTVKNHVLDAVQSIVNEEPVAMKQTKPYGCLLRRR